MAEKAIADDLWAIERELAAGDGATYRRHLSGDAIVIVPGAKLDMESTVAAMDDSPGWDEFSFTDEAFRLLGDGAAMLSYRFDGRRADSIYAAILTTLYIRDEQGASWRLVFHQQTPISDAAAARSGTNEER